MAKSKKTLEITQTKTKANRQEIQINDMDYTTSAEPKAFADGRPVFCAHDKIVPITDKMTMNNVIFVVFIHI